MNNIMGVLIGGLIPAFAFGTGAILQKYSNDIGIGQSNYLMFFATGMAMASGIAFFVFPENDFSMKAGLFATGHGLLFGVGFALIALGLTVYAQPISKLVPLVNMSTLVAVALGLVLFSEHQRLNLNNLLTGSVLIIVGGILVGRA